MGLSSELRCRSENFENNYFEHCELSKLDLGYNLKTQALLLAKHSKILAAQGLIDIGATQRARDLLSEVTSDAFAPHLDRRRKTVRKIVLEDEINKIEVDLNDVGIGIHMCCL